MKAVIYARYSSDTQTEQSIEGQLRDCYSYAKMHDITVMGEYIDRAKSGTNDQRADFQRMIKDSEKKAFDVILLWKTDRFARNRYDSAMYKAKLKKNGVKLIYAKESIPDGPEGIILESLLEGMAEYYSANLSQNIRRGMRENALKCKVVGGNLALGYKADSNKNFIIDENAAPVVRKIFKMYNDGEPVIDICRMLNDLGFKTSRGSEYNKNSLRHILKNRKYIGVYTMNDIEIEDGIPNIIDKELFDSVQRKLKEIKKAPARNKAKVDYLLSGKVYCGHCNGAMIGESGKGKKGVVYNYYKCSTKKREKTCDKSTVKKEWLESLVVDETIANIFQDDIVQIIADKCISIMEHESKDNTEMLSLKRQLVETKKSLKNIMAAIEQGIITKTTKDRLSELEKAQENLEYEIQMSMIKQPDLTKEQIVYLLNKYKDLDYNIEKNKADMIECFINSVYLSDEKLVIAYNLTNEKSELVCSDLVFNGGGGGSRTHVRKYFQKTFSECRR